ncbi:AbrB/MazE/SpoVT family DNA-binding domain-containing protein [Metallosphaera hakonensis]|uniref:AbrB family transcriptional regulator n=1 Tax=Metallosphaera hakonensis JCM 8857 = DSM 7519 TaxID=1293036 RepID=A0A2U9IT69_9CREN|nr:phosphate uptake regulator PhoU [Metallosphaera hakonensis]AWR99152.1 phosphate uptake regulator PhoU [Metallosphaera hakonensis JCM 8857 = DSM 7519]
MSVRRLQKIKGGSYIISLPSDWVRKMGLDVKAGLKVYEVYDGLKIRPPIKPNAEKAIELTDLDTTKYLIITYYMQGLDKIVVKSKSVIPLDVKKELRELQLQCYGLEVESETFDSISFKVNVALNNNITDSMKQFISKIGTLLNDTELLLENFNEEMRDDLLARISILNKDYRVLIRMIAVGVQRDDDINFNIYPKDLILFAVVMRDLGRFVTHLMLFLKEVKIEQSRAIISSFKLLREIFMLAVEMFISEDLSSMPRIREGFRLLERDAPKNEAGKELVRMGSYCVAIMDDAVNKSVRLYDFNFKGS